MSKKITNGGIASDIIQVGRLINEIGTAVTQLNELEDRLKNTVGSYVGNKDIMAAFSSEVSYVKTKHATLLSEKNRLFELKRNTPKEDLEMEAPVVFAVFTDATELFESINNIALNYVSEFFGDSESQETPSGEVAPETSIETVQE